MSIAKKIYKIGMSLTTILSPRLASRIFYFKAFKSRLNLKDPQWFSEKLMKLKLDNYNNNPTVWRNVDKLMVREYLKEKGVQEENLPKILGVYKSARDIDFNELPNKFVLKCTHGAGFNIICKYKSKLDQEWAVRQLDEWLKTRFGLDTAEVHYGKVSPVIICEAFIESAKSELPSDYKIYCFNGIPLYVMACTDREDGVSKVNLFDLEWGDTGYIKEQYAAKGKVEAPATLSRMIEMAADVSKEFPFVRVDFYEDGGIPVLGEMTYTPHACVNGNMTRQGQEELGRHINTDKFNKLEA